jgi:ribonuclease P protein subunit POP4
MTPITTHNITRHELIGLQVSITKSSHSEYIGLKGKIIGETRNMLVISDGEKKKHVPKRLNVFCLTLPDNSTTEIEGYKILSRPIERIKNC